MKKVFSKNEAIKFGWETMKKNLGFFIPAFIITGIILFFLEFLSELFKTGFFISGMFQIAGKIVLIIFVLGYIKVSLKLCDGQPIGPADLFKSANLFFEYLAASMLSAVAVLFGFIFFLVPGIILGIMFQFYGYFIVDKGAGPIEAMKRSCDITRGMKWQLFLFGLLLALLNFAGFLALGVGIFTTLPAGLIASAYVFRKLSAQNEEGAVGQPG
jgi:uncharacterized membrane protein